MRSSHVRSCLQSVRGLERCLKVVRRNWVSAHRCTSVLGIYRVLVKSLQTLAWSGSNNEHLYSCRSGRDGLCQKYIAFLTCRAVCERRMISVSLLELEKV